MFLDVTKDETNDANVKDQAIWALGNIAGDENFFRNQILNLGSIPILIE